MQSTPSAVALTFKYDDIKPEGEPFSADFPLDVAREALEGYVGESGYWVEEPIRASGTLYRTSSGEVIMDARLKGRVRFLCVSCGASRHLPIETREDFVIVPEGHAAARVEEDLTLEGDVELDPDVYTFTPPDLNVTAILRESLILEAPLHPRCDAVGEVCVRYAGLSDEAPGFAPGGVDPRFAPFLAMRDALAQKASPPPARSKGAGGDES
ncbi:MAG: DUF177 domain-containing protein [Deltaproteobacteria bacterium]|nr:DUF177 domain-containing protein [Deltaproteobacteria bacterium]